MFGLLDFISVGYDRLNALLSEELPRENPISEASFLPEREDKYQGKDYWICFFPNSVIDHKKLFFNRVIPPANLILYRTPKSAIQKDPSQTKNAIQRTVSDAISRAKAKALESRNLGVIGISLGCVHAYLTANALNPSKLLLIVPGARLGPCASYGMGTYQIIRKTHYSQLKYSRALRELDPVNNIREINGELCIYLNLMDRMVGTRRGFRLLRAFNKNGNKVNIQLYRYYGHGMVIRHFNDDGLAYKISNH